MLGYLTLLAVLAAPPLALAAGWLLVPWSVWLWQLARNAPGAKAIGVARWGQRRLLWVGLTARSALALVHGAEASLIMLLMLSASLPLTVTLAFAGCLLLASLAEGGFRLFLLVFIVVLMVVLLIALAGLLLAPWQVVERPPALGFGQRIAPLVLLAVYGGAFAALGYGRVRRLKQARRSDAESLRELMARSDRLARYLPSTLVQQVAAAPDCPAQRQRAWLVVVFVDLCDFTELSARLDAEVLGPLLDDYLQLVNRLAVEHDGILGKVLGDGVLIFWQHADGGLAVESRAQAARQASRFVLAVNVELAILTRLWRERGEQLRLRARAAITCGYCMLGDWGAPEVGDAGGNAVSSRSQSSTHRRPLEYTFIGRAVNLAARLQEHAAPGGLILDAGVAELLAGTLPLAGPRRLVIKGQGELEVFVVLDPSQEERQRNLTLVR